LEELSVGEGFGLREDRYLVLAAGLEVALEEIRADVVALRQLQPPHLKGQCSFGPRWEAGSTGGKYCEAGVRAGLEGGRIAGERRCWGGAWRVRKLVEERTDVLAFLRSNLLTAERLFGTLFLCLRRKTATHPAPMTCCASA